MSVEQNYDKWYEFTGEQDLPLADLDVILMRKDRRLIPSLSTRPIFWNVPKIKGRLIVNKPSQPDEFYFLGDNPLVTDSAIDWKDLHNACSKPE